MRLNRITFEIGLLTAQLADRSGRGLNTNGSLQKLVTNAELYENLSQASVSIRELLNAARPLMRNLNDFAERISRDPAIIGRGVLQR